jgi:PAS domain S-box-containing protein
LGHPEYIAMQAVGKTDLHILMLEDDALDAELNLAQLKLLDGYNCIVQWVVDRESYISALEKGGYDLVLSDYNLPQYNGLEALNDLKARNQLVPFIFVTGTLNEETAADTIKAGAWDYVVKDRLLRLSLAVRSALQLKEEKRKKILAELQFQKLSMAIEQSPLLVVITNIKQEIEYVNARFTEVAGYTYDEVNGKDMIILVPEENRSGYVDSIIEKLSQGLVWNGELQSRKKNGSLFWESITISPLKNEDGVITHFIVVMEDISQRKKMEQDLIKALDRAERSDKLKEAFLQNLSHEIRTPLNAIVGFSELLNESGALNEKQSSFTDIIRNSSHQLLGIVTDILTIARIQTGQEEIVNKMIDIHRLLDHIFAIFQARIEEKKLEFHLSKPESVSNMNILSDETKLTQILSNLLSNAYKFTKQGQIEFGYKLKTGFIEFFVRDTGIGISEEAQQFIFDRFRQADSSIHTYYGGTGLGLSISKSFAEMLGGSIALTSKLDEGSTFLVAIPYQSEDVPFESNKPETLPFSEKPLVILVAEDEEYNYLLFEAVFSDPRYTILHANNGVEAVLICRNSNKIDIVFMDIKMAEMNGIEAMIEIKKMYPQLPIIAQTAFALESERQELFNAGFDDYLSKPIRKEDLMEKLHRFTR